MLTTRFTQQDRGRTDMWKKDEETTAQSGRSSAETGSSPATGTGSAAPSSRTATIGSAITIDGEVSGDEDLLIQGRVDGSIDLEEHTVTVGSDGRVTASIVARVVTVEGRVDGDIEARERIVLRSSSRVEGDITAPRVVLEDGARFRGGVDMGDAGSTASSKSSSGSSSSSTGKGGDTSSSSKGGGSNGSKDSSTGSSSRREAAASASSSGKGSSS